MKVRVADGIIYIEMPFSEVIGAALAAETVPLDGSAFGMPDPPPTRSKKRKCPKLDKGARKVARR